MLTGNDQRWRWSCSPHSGALSRPAVSGATAGRTVCGRSTVSAGIDAVMVSRVLTRGRENDMRCRMPGLHVRTLLSVVTAAAAVAVTLAGPAVATTSPTAVTLCRPWQALRVTGAGGQRFVIRNKPSINHDDQGMC